MRVGVLGSGQVGQALGRGFASRKHEVMLGTRSPESEKARVWVAEGEARSAGTFADAAAFGEVIVLATPGLAAEEALELAGPDRLVGKLVIDATNPLEYPGDGSVQLGFGFDDSLGERVQRQLPESKVVKAFNTVGNPYMVDPDLPSGPPTMLLCGNDAEAQGDRIGDLRGLRLGGGGPGADRALPRPRGDGDGLGLLRPDPGHLGPCLQDPSQVSGALAGTVDGGQIS